MSDQPCFSSPRERRLWVWAAVLVLAIYSTLGIAGSLAEVFLERRVFDSAMFYAFFALVGSIVIVAAVRHPKTRDIGVALGVAMAMVMLSTRLGVPLEHRSHLAEYSMVAVLIHQALLERARRGRHVPAPALFALGATALLGWIDEGIQALLPNRVYDLVDVAFNTGAALVPIAMTVAIGWVRAWYTGRRPPPA